MSKSTFGYGSLILPTSVIARFDDDIGPAKPIYDEGKTLGDEGLLRDEAVEAWKNEKEKDDGIEMVPVKIPGFRRNYTLEKYGGTMLEGESGDRDDFINGVVIRGLTDEQYEGIASTENYGSEEVPPEEIESYVDGLEIDEPVTLYTESVDDRSDYFTSRTRQPTYHARILKGIEMLGEMYGEEVAQEFLDDFEENTYENPVPGNSFSEETPEDDRRELRSELMNTVRAQDRSIQGFKNLIEGIDQDYQQAR
ncbi:hypothetical protein GKQ38_00715 [Candidatus Nanohaloarchaea archaeon]|nr:hypothetical protein GKQ38_00715 [Candidatus Nanohaloarchaea archaeon]